MALEATHSDRLVRDDVRQEPSPMDRVGGDTKSMTSIQVNYSILDKSSIQWRLRKPKEGA